MAASSASPANEVARRYASAAFDLAQQKGNIATVSDDLKSLETMISDSADLSRMLESPAYSREDKTSAIKALGEKARFAQLTTNFLATMASNGRAHDIPGALTAFDALYAKHRGVKRAIARTASAMSDEQRKRLEGVLAGAIGSDVELTAEVDPALVGGIQLRVGSTLIDASVAAKLDRMNTAMKGA